MHYDAVNPVPTGFAIYIRVRNAKAAIARLFLRLMDSDKLKQAYRNQKYGAKRRGIEWQLTFEQWLEFWGDDLPKRGRGRNDLSMQRPCDSGPYAMGNIRKGTPADNARTRKAMHPKVQAVTTCGGRRRQIWQEDEPRLGYASAWDMY